ncbi:hypothetical protein ABVK25_006489 [Lepraria finkii]|uniref:Transcription factor domain-containing protein n=1 Tax=Lepraria finkii TaxID=1340010 RepID=A0ABR4B8H2_9LECA
MVRSSRLSLAWPTTNTSNSKNCTKHNSRCDYMDNPPSEDAPRSPKEPNLQWTPKVEAEIAQWQQRGVLPFPDMNLQSFQHLRGFPVNDLRLIHHILEIHRDMRLADFVQCTSWVEQIPQFLEVAVTHDFVMSSILALSATHLAWLTNSVETWNLAYYHRSVANNGTKRAIGNFSNENSDAILAASILLSWQSSDWEEWTLLLNGISSVVSSMDPWKGTSRFAIYIEENPSFFSPKSMPATALFGDDQSTVQALNALYRLSIRLPTVHPLAQRLREILNWAHNFQACSTSMQSHQLFEKLQPLRQWLFWMPVTLVKNNDMSISAMVLLAQLYTLALAIDSSIPELSGAALGSLTVHAIEQIDIKLRHKQSYTFGIEMSQPEMDDLMQFTRLTATQNRLASESVSAQIKLEDMGARSPGIQAHPPHSPYGFRPASIGSQPGTPDWPPQWSSTPPMLASHSFEDLSHPPSPFLQYSGSISPGHSQIADSLSGPNRLSFDNRSLPGHEYSLRGDSPTYSPAACSPGFTTDQDEESWAWGGPSPAYSQGASSTMVLP